MKNNLLFNFVVNKENNSVNVEREFDADVHLVWKAWTTPELLDQWWAPHPYKAVTKSMDFREGGTWLYYMLSPENHKHWCKNDYIEISPNEFFSGLDAFCDENGVVNKSMPRTKWSNTFKQEKEGKTLVSIVSQYEKLSDLETVIKMGFQEGFTAGLNQLDTLLTTLKEGNE